MSKETGKPEPLEFGDSIFPPFYGSGEMLTWDTKALLDSIDRKRLYGSFRHDGKNNNSKLPQIDEADFDDLFKLLTQEIIADNLIDARGFYGFFPVISDDDKLILLSPGDYHTEIASFSLPRLEEKKWRSFADYFRPEGDIFSVSIVTIGFALSGKCMKDNQENDSKSFYSGSLGDYIIEIVTAKINAEITRALFLPNNRGLSCSFGQPGLPELNKQQILLEIMFAEDRLGITLSKDFQLQPKHSSLYIYAQHPEAGCFSAH